LKRLRLTFTAAVAKSHQVHFVTLNGRRYKRVTFAHASEAIQLEDSLEAVAAAGVFPRLVLRHENQIWVEFIIGQRLTGVAARERKALSAFFAGIYQQHSERVVLEATSLPARLARDLDFLHDIGVLPKDMTRELEALAARLQPETALLGYDYVDPVLKNFLVAEGGLIAVDVEGLRANQLLGVGVAKARLRWLQQDSEAFLDRMVSAGAPDIRPQFAWAELCFLADWTKHKVLQGKRHYVRPDVFRAFLDEHSS